MLNDRPGSGTRLLRTLFPALLAPSELLVFGPFATYTRNHEEFVAPFWAIASRWLPAYAAIVIVLVAVGVILHEAAWKRYVAVLFALGILLWAQGNLLVPSYGPLYGERLDLGRDAWRMPIELGLWGVVLGLAAHFADRVSRIAPFGSQVLVGLLALMLVVSTVSGREAREGAAEATRWSAPPEEVYRLSSGQNLIHIVLDGFLSEVFAELLEGDRAALERDFDGFVFFADHLGAFPTTRASMPAMLSGETFRNQEPFSDFWRTARRRSIFTALAAHGYRIRSVMFHEREQPHRSLRDSVVSYNVPTPYGSYGDYVRFAAAQVFDLTLFRHVPHGVKSWVYNDDAWLAQSWSPKQRARAPDVRSIRPSNHLVFMEDFTGRLRVITDEPVYLFVHLAVPHPPLVVDGDCSFVGPQSVNRTTYGGQARCAVTAVRRFLDQLRTLGIYDRSVIVLTSDHGWKVSREDHPFLDVQSPAGRMDGVVQSAMPLLLVKPRGGAGPLRTSYAPTSITDIPATLLDLAGLPDNELPGQSVLQLDENSRRRRTFAYHTWENANWRIPYQDVLFLFSVDGRVLDPGAWTLERAIFAPVPDGDAQLERHTYGLSDTQRDAAGPYRPGDVYVAIYAPPDARLVTIAASKSPRARYPQTMTIRVDGRVVARHELVNESTYTLRQPLAARGRDAKPFIIELLLDPPAYEDDGSPSPIRYRRIEWSR